MFPREGSVWFSALVLLALVFVLGINARTKRPHGDDSHDPNKRSRMDPASDSSSDEEEAPPDPWPTSASPHHAFTCNCPRHSQTPHSEQYPIVQITHVVPVPSNTVDELECVMNRVNLMPNFPRHLRVITYHSMVNGTIDRDFGIVGSVHRFETDFAGNPSNMDYHRDLDGSLEGEAHGYLTEEVYDPMEGVQFMDMSQPVERVEVIDVSDLVQDNINPYDFIEDVDNSEVDFEEVDYSDASNLSEAEYNSDTSNRSGAENDGSSNNYSDDDSANNDGDDINYANDQRDAEDRIGGNNNIEDTDDDSQDRDYSVLRFVAEVVFNAGKLFK